MTLKTSSSVDFPEKRWSKEKLRLSAADAEVGGEPRGAAASLSSDIVGVEDTLDTIASPIPPVVRRRFRDQLMSGRGKSPFGSKLISNCM
jgi:hypothetical protein